jgi:hypothetical protein
MHYITIPEEIQLTNPETEEVLWTQDPDGKRVAHAPVTFWTFVRNNLLSQKEHFGKGHDGLEKTLQIREALKDATACCTIALDTEAWKTLKTSVGTTTWPYPLLATQYMPFMKAILDAADKPPAKEPNEE